ncbi:MAG: M23 family metallopeptidase [Anaerolineales bacterium]
MADAYLYPITQSLALANAKSVSRSSRLVTLISLLAVALSACASAAADEGTRVAPTASPQWPTAAPTATLGRTPLAEPTAPPALTVAPVAVTIQAPPPDSQLQVAEWNPPPYDPPLALRSSDHFYLAPPLASGTDSWLHPQYRYGNTHFGEEPTHTGVDIVAPLGTSVSAAGSGYVMWAGYGLYRGVEDETDPYGLAVAIQHDFGYRDQVLFTVYAHLKEIDVIKGQYVNVGDLVGLVGDTGHASGPHLHFEVRLGENRYFATRNPELWLVPVEGWGVLAGRILGWRDHPLFEQLIRLRNLETNEVFEAWSYVEDTVNPDGVYQENVVIGNLPAGPYEVRTNYVGHTYSAQLYIFPGQTNQIEFHGREGFALEDR